MVLLAILMALICFIILRRLGSNSHDLPRNYPLVGMLPALLCQVQRIHDWITEITVQNASLNFHFCGPWFCNMDMLITMDPANIHYIMSTNFANFPKGSEFRKIFDVLGDGIFNADHELWQNQRRLAMSFINHKKFHQFLTRTNQQKIQNGLIPILDRASREGLVVDLQDLFQRFAFDTICKLVTGFDPACLSSGFPEVPFAKALDDAEKAIFFRHALPEFAWKLQRWVGIGEEKTLSEAWKSFDRIIGKYIKTKRDELRQAGKPALEEDGCDLLTSYMSMKKDSISGLDCNDNKFLRDTILNLMVAGRDSTTSALTWFFWNLSKNPMVETKIREELSSIAGGGEKVLESGDFINKLVYLHGAICESLRLFPPVPFQHKSPIKPVMLPSGHSVSSHSRILFSLYAMGRMPSIWGKDCLEFKPERWITEKGTIRHEPSYKFLVFNAGPRTCIGKEITFMQLKTALATIMRNFHVQVEEDQDVRPRASVILHMKHGLKARISRVSGHLNM